MTEVRNSIQQESATKVMICDVVVGDVNSGNPMIEVTNTNPQPGSTIELNDNNILSKPSKRKMKSKRLMRDEVNNP